VRPFPPCHARTYPPLVRAVEAVLVDAGGVLLLPDRAVVSAALGPGFWDEAPEALDRAHYRAIAEVDEARPESDRAILPTYVAAYLEALEVLPDRRDLIDGLVAIFDAGAPSWTTVIPESAAALRAIAARRRVAIVSNSQGWMERHLRETGVCQVGPGPGATVSAVVDSGLVGAEKPDPRIFRAALKAAGAPAGRAVHVGDSVWFDVEGAVAAGVRAVHFDPHRLCTVGNHKHIVSLADLDLDSAS
jgi:putative hydrolase of the HAD superfamily